VPGAYQVGTPASFIPSTLEQHAGENYDFLDDAFLDPTLNQQHDFVMDPIAFPSSEVIENMIYEPGNIDWVCSLAYHTIQYLANLDS